LIIAFILTGCTKEIPKKQTVKRKGLVYEKGQKKLFTGYVVGKGREDYHRVICTYKKQYKNGKLDGFSTYWHKNGKVESKEPYKDGLLNGVVSRYYDNGQIESRIHIVNGMRGGMKGEQYWSKDGKKIKR